MSYVLDFTNKKRFAVAGVYGFYNFDICISPSDRATKLTQKRICGIVNFC